MSKGRRTATAGVEGERRGEGSGADRQREPGAIGALLRRNGLAARAGARRRGRQPDPSQEVRHEIVQLRADKARLEAAAGGGDHQCPKKVVRDHGAGRAPVRERVVVALDLTALAGMTRAAEVFDVPYSGPQLKTLKYHPTFPERFGSVQDARAFCQGFFPWYNSEHRHDGLGLFTPETVHYGHVDGIPEQRRTVH